MDRSKIPKKVVLIVDEIDHVIETKPFFVNKTIVKKKERLVGVHTASYMTEFHRFIGLTATCMQTTLNNFSCMPYVKVLRLGHLDQDRSELKEVVSYKKDSERHKIITQRVEQEIAKDRSVIIIDGELHKT